MKNESILIVGSGYMAEEYLKVIKDIGYKAIIVGRGVERVNKLKSSFPEFQFYSGGIENYIENFSDIPHIAINTVNVEYLYSTTLLLINAGIKNILLEKPGVCKPHDINELALLAQEKDANVLLAYNRRFYSSTLKAQEIIKEDGGVTSFIFEFTEWSHKISQFFDGSKHFQYWFLANSSHVVDLAFYLGGYPIQMSTFTCGSLEWHPNAAVFSGAGKTDLGALFSYHANWKAPGRWYVEICTNKHRLYFKPMETLFIQEIGSLNITPVDFDEKLDKMYKPGMFLQVKSFLEKEYSNFCSIQQQKKNIEQIYIKIGDY